MTTLRDVMTPVVQSTTRDAPIATAAEAMVRNRIGSTLVMTGSTLVGIFTERDVLRAAAEGRDLSRERVDDWMTVDPVTAAPESDVDRATETMIGGGFRHLPVVEHATVVGIVSLRDVLSAQVRRA